MQNILALPKFQSAKHDYKAWICCIKANINIIFCKAALKLCTVKSAIKITLTWLTNWIFFVNQVCCSTNAGFKKLISFCIWRKWHLKSILEKKGSHKPDRRWVFDYSLCKYCSGCVYVQVIDLESLSNPVLWCWRKLSFVLTRQSFFPRPFLFVWSLIRLFRRALFSLLSSLSFLNFHVFFCCLLLNMKAASPFPPASLSTFWLNVYFFPFLFPHCFICRSLFSPPLSLHFCLIHLLHFIPHFFPLFFLALWQVYSRFTWNSQFIDIVHEH